MTTEQALRDALAGLIDVIEAAGLHNLTNGVQLGQTVWYVKACDAIASGLAALSQPQAAPAEADLPASDTPGQLCYYAHKVRTSETGGMDPWFEWETPATREAWERAAKAVIDQPAKSAEQVGFFRDNFIIVRESDDGPIADGSDGKHVIARIERYLLAPLESPEAQAAMEAHKKRFHLNPLYANRTAPRAEPAIITDAQCDDAIRAAGLWQFALAIPQNLAMLRSLCREALSRATSPPPSDQAAPRAEPVAEAFHNGIDLTIRPLVAFQRGQTVLLYTNPQQGERKPLTDEQIHDLYSRSAVALNDQCFRAGVRLAEQAHGIVGNEEQR